MSSIFFGRSRWVSIIHLLCFIAAGGLLIYFIVQKYKLGLTRYFDADELAYLNWTSHILQGSLPYRDFLYQLPPGFLLALAPILNLSQEPRFFLIGGRIFAFVIQVSLTLVIGILFWKMRKSWIAVFASLFFAFLPLPSDKLLEIRPDTLGVFFVMLGSFFQILWMEKEEKKYIHVYMFLAGLSYGFSVFILQKTIPHVFIATIISFIWLYNKKKTNILPYIFGLCILFIGLGMWALMNNLSRQTWYFLIHFPTEAAQMANVYYIPPWQFFEFSNIYYGSGAWNLGYIGNQIIWIVGLLVAIIRFLTSLFQKNPNESYGELLLSGAFLIQVLFFIYLSPFKHAQYLIPLAVFVSFYAADFLDILWQNAKKSRITLVIYGLAICIGFLFIYHGYNAVNIGKLNWTNKKEHKDLDTILQTVPRSEYVFDLIGLTLIYPQPYFVSCLPFGQFSQYLSIILPSLTEALGRTDTRYIYQGEAKRVMTLSQSDQEYIRAHFTPVLNDVLLVRNDEVDQFLLRLKLYETR